MLDGYMSDNDKCEHGWLHPHEHCIPCLKAEVQRLSESTAEWKGHAERMRSYYARVCVSLEDAEAEINRLSGAHVCVACGHMGPEAPPSGRELPIVKGALDAQADAEKRLIEVLAEVALLREALADPGNAPLPHALAMSQANLIKRRESERDQARKIAADLRAQNERPGGYWKPFPWEDK